MPLDPKALAELAKEAPNNPVLMVVLVVLLLAVIGDRIINAQRATSESRKALRSQQADDFTKVVEAQKAVIKGLQEDVERLTQRLENFDERLSRVSRRYFAAMTENARLRIRVNALEGQLGLEPTVWPKDEWEEL